MITVPGQIRESLTFERKFKMFCSFGEGKPATVSAGGRDFEVTPDLLDIQEKEEKLNGRCTPPLLLLINKPHSLTETKRLQQLPVHAAAY